MDIATIYTYSTTTGGLVPTYYSPVIFYIYIFTIILGLFLVGVLYKLFKE